MKNYLGNVIGLGLAAIALTGFVAAATPDENPELQFSPVIINQEAAVAPTISVDGLTWTEGTTYIAPEIRAFELSEDDANALMRIAMAEAGGEDLETKILIMNTVMNRVAAPQFPDTVEAVITQPGQFDPVANGSFYTVEPSEDCAEALKMVLAGRDDSHGALYFESCEGGSQWHQENLEMLFKWGVFRFYKEL